MFSRLKEWLSKTENIALIIALFALIVAVLTPVFQDYKEAKKRQVIIFGENVYNLGVKNTLAETFPEDDGERDNQMMRMIDNRFSLEVYKNNWDIILQLNCAESLVRAIGEMEAINMTNDSIRQLYDQEGLVFLESQWKNTKARSENYYNELKAQLDELDVYLKGLEGCRY